jgi:TPR repeat protein
LHAQPSNRQDTIKAVDEAAEKGDFNRVYELLLPLAEAGDAKAQFSIAVYLVNRVITSIPGDRQAPLAVEWLRKSAKLGWIDAMEVLSNTYAAEWAVIPRDSELAECYRDAASGRVNVATCTDLERTKGYLSPP